MKLLLASLVVMAPHVVSATEGLDLAEATPGRTGVCVTEMDGGERVEIPLTVLGTVGSGTPSGEMVLVRLDHPRLLETGIIAGMSGSPVYLDGKLLGALAYGWAFASEPIGGVTPFARMLEIDPSPPISPLTTRPSLEEILVAAGDGSLGEMVVDWLVPASSRGSRPLPLAIAGWQAPADGSWMAESWRRMGWVAAAGGGDMESPAADEIAPGSMVAAVMVEGDVTLAAGGTVTEVRDDRLWAFGHASLGAGSTSMPLSRAGVVAVLPNLMSSFKFFTIGEPIGAIVADRRDGVVGLLGAEAPMTPVTVTVDGRAYSYRSVRHPVLMPLLAGYLAHASHAVDGRSFGDQTVATRVSVAFEGLDAAAVSATFASTQASVEASAFVAAVVAYLEGSAYEGPRIESIDVSLETVEQIKSNKGDSSAIRSVYSVYSFLPQDQPVKLAVIDSIKNLLADSEDLMDQEESDANRPAPSLPTPRYGQPEDAQERGHQEQVLDRRVVDRVRIRRSQVADDRQQRESKDHDAQYPGNPPYPLCRTTVGVASA